VDRLSEDPERELAPEDRLAGRLPLLERVLGLRTDVRDFGTLIDDRGMACPEPGMPDCIPADEPDMAISPRSITPADAAGILAEVLDPVLPVVLEPVLVDPVRVEPDRDVLALVDPVRADVVRRAVDLPVADLAGVPADRAVVLRDVPVRDVPDLVERVDVRVERDAGRVVPPDGLAAGLRLAVLRDRVVVPAARTGFADDIDLAAAVSALAAVCMALVAVFIDRMADDIVWADAVALVAAAVIFVAADVTLVAALETPLAADAGVAELRLDVLRVLLAAVLRVAELRLAVVERERAAEGRDAVERDVMLRDLVVVLRAELAVLLAGRAAELRVVLVVPVEVLELDVDLGLLAVALDALRLADLRAVLAELRRVAARVVDCTGTDLPPS
jgi:hypothetical protein